MSAAERVIVPLTLAQQIRAFPYKFHYKHHKPSQMLVYGFLLTLPVMYYFQKLSYAPSNVKKHEQYLAKEKILLQKHLEHLEKYRHGH